MTTSHNPYEYVGKVIKLAEDSMNKRKPAQPKTSHTPTPWRVFNHPQDYGNIIVSDDENTTIAETNWTGDMEDGSLVFAQSNAAFIVTAVNAYERDQATIEALTEALEARLDYNQLTASAFFTKYPEALEHKRTYTGDGKPTEEWIDHRCALALAQAKGGSDGGN